MPAFNAIPNGVPGIETRLPVLFSEGVSAGRIDLPTFVRLTSTNAARLFGLAGRKGTLAPGAMPTSCCGTPMPSGFLTNADLHHAIDYTPWEGMRLKGLPHDDDPARRGRGAGRPVLAEPGSGRFLARGPYALATPSGRVPDGFDAASRR